MRNTPESRSGVFLCEKIFCQKGLFFYCRFAILSPDKNKIFLSGWQVLKTLKNKVMGFNWKQIAVIFALGILAAFIYDWGSAKLTSANYEGEDGYELE